MNRYKNLMVNSGIFAIANFGSRLINFFFVPLYTFWLTTEEYGTVDTLVATVNLLIPILTLSLPDCVMRFAMKSDSRKENILSNAIVSILFMLAIFSLMYYPLRSIKIIEYYWLPFYALIFLQSFNSLFSQYVRGIGKVAVFAWNGVLSTGFQIFFNILFLCVWKWNIRGYLLALNLSFLFCNIYLLMMSDIVKRFSWRELDFALLKEMLYFSLPLVPTAVMWWVMNSSDKYVIWGILGLSATGVYAVASKIPHIINMLFSIFQQAWQLSAIDAYGSNEEENFYSIVYVCLFQFLSIGTSFFLMIQKEFIFLFY